MLNKNNKNSEKNLKLMGLSASVLVGLFIYTIIKSDSVMQNGSYFLGIGFLLALMTASFYIQKYKNKIRKIIPKNKFQDQLNTNIANKTNQKEKTQDVTFKQINDDKIMFNYSTEASLSFPLISFKYLFVADMSHPFEYYPPLYCE